ncbi:carboxylate-amine ligase [Catenuloplanes indicus]|uniref:carboxylate-amine ligase n=1 Tax=Catenuloplanes indicus TaxID=137267 RepID=UPI0027D7C666|nr:glutamate--cysteine ligase [Catenuloplanes indicus]
MRRWTRPGFAAGPVVPTIGVEEELLLLDPQTGENMPVADRVRAGLPHPVREHSRAESRRSMIEMVSPVCTRLPELSYHLHRHRRIAALAARDSGARLTAIGATPLRAPGPHVPTGQRDGLCGLHVHVGVPDRELAVQVCAHLRVWLPLLQAMSANSPIFDGVDTGHASWRSVQIQRWPSLGPTPVFGSAAEYDEAVHALRDSGVLVGDAKVHWYARVSERCPTVEIRVGDVCATARDTVLITALLRALVATAIDDVRDGIPAPDVPECTVTAAHWRAARDGLDAELFDLRVGHSRPAGHLVGDLLATASPALIRHGDLPSVIAALSLLRRVGTGAARQRRVLQATGDLRHVLNMVARLTVMG